MEEITVVCVTDSKYVKYLKPFLKSINKNSNSLRVYIKCVGIDESIKKTFYEWHDKLILENDETILDETRWYSRNKDVLDAVFLQNIDPSKAKLVNQKICYCNNIRFRLLRELLDLGYDNLLFMDVDMIVRDDLTKYLKDLTEPNSEYDISMQPYLISKTDKSICYDLKDEHTLDKNIFEKLYCVEFMLIKNNERTKELFKECESEVDNILGLYTWGHAPSFGKCVRKIKDLKICELPHCFKDEGFGQNSPVWSGEDFRKLEEHENYCKELTCMTYINEMKQYGF
jgi:lipopolysaccharide biosynthesis glycosyltransferase